MNSWSIEHPMKEKIFFFAALLLILGVLQYAYYLHVRSEYFNKAPEISVLSGVFSRSGGPGIGYRTLINNQQFTCATNGAISIFGAGGSSLNCSLISDEHIGKPISISYLKTPQWSANDNIGQVVLRIDAEGITIYQRTLSKARSDWETLSVFNVISNAIWISFCITSIALSKDTLQKSRKNKPPRKLEH